MWSRSRLDLSLGDLLSALGSALAPPDPARSEQGVAALLGPEAAVFLTVRTAWDALLAELALPPGSEVVVTAANIPDMFNLLEHHGLVPVPVDLDPDTMGPLPGRLAAALGARTRLVLVTHLLGTRLDLEEVFAAAGAAGLPVVEDCAQAFDGPGYRGDPRALASLFSFGPIKTATALGGGVAVVRDQGLRERMLARVASYPRQSERAYAAVALKYALLLALSGELAYTLFVRAAAALGRSHDAIINGAVLGLKGADYWAALRRRPSAALLATLHRRLRRWDDRRLRARAEAGDALAAALPPGLQALGAKAPRRSWWLFAVRAADPAALIAALRAEGFDATGGASRLAAARAPADRPELEPARVAEAMRAVVYLPAYPEMPAAERARLAAVLQRLYGRGPS